MYERNHILEKFRSLTVWNKGSQRAPHKPLLCLLAISKMLSDKRRLFRFKDIELALTNLLSEFGPPRKVCHPEYPFWCLQNDAGLWEVQTTPPITELSKGLPTRAALLRTQAKGGFSKNVFAALLADAALRSDVIIELLSGHFPETMHDDILQSLSLPSRGESFQFASRDSMFRESVLAAYEYQCAVCGFNVRIARVVIAVEAAHVMWHQAGGPDTRDNGIALCSLHHKLFDRGAFTITSSLKILVSERAYGTTGFEEHLGRYHKRSMRPPVRGSYRPTARFLNWHAVQVFLGPERE